MLKVKNLNVSYGAIHAIHDVSLEVCLLYTSRPKKGKARGEFVKFM